MLGLMTAHVIYRLASVSCCVSIPFECGKSTMTASTTTDLRTRWRFFVTRHDRLTFSKSKETEKCV